MKSFKQTRRLAAISLLTIATLACFARAQDGAEGAGGESPPPAATPVQTQAPAPPPIAFDSPRSTMRTFLEAMADDDPARAATAMDLSGSAVFLDAAADLAFKLHYVINRLEYIDFESTDIPGPDGAARTDSGSWQYFPQVRQWWDEGGFDEVAAAAPDARIVFARQADGSWRFSRETVAGLESFWKAVDAAGIEPVSGVVEITRLADRIRGLWPRSFTTHTFLTLEYWQWITLLIFIAIGVVLDFVVRFFLTVVSRNLIRRRGGAARTETLRRTVRPFGLVAAAVFWLWAMCVLGLETEALRVLVPAVKLYAMLALVWSAYRVTDLVGEVASSTAQGTETKFDDLLVPLVRKIVKVFITVFGLIYIADSLHIPVMPLVTGLGIGGVGFAFAAKDTLEHLFGSVTVIADRPFEVGDWIQVGDVEGTVEELGFRSTRVRTFYNSQVTVPNGNLVRAVVDNFGRRKYRRWTTHLNVTYDTSPEKLEAFCEGIREILRLHPYTRKDYYQVWLHKFGAHSLDVLLYMFFEAPDWNTELRERHRLMMDILRLADHLGVEFAFPTQTLHMHSETGAPPTPAGAPEPEADRRARLQGRRAVRSLVANAPWRHEKPAPYVFDYADDTDPGDDTQIESTIAGSAGDG